MTDPIYRLWNFGFGDHWQTMCLLRRMAKVTCRLPSLSYMQHGRNFGDRLLEIDQALGMQLFSPIMTAAEPTHELDGYDVWHCPAVATRLTWSFNPSGMGVVAYQFDGESSPDKNPSKRDEERILGHLREAGYEPIKLGKHLSVQQCVDLCTVSALFVGSCSGMSHLAHSVGVPVYLLEYGLPVITCHRQKQFVICKGAEHFIAEVRGYLQLIKNLRALANV